MTVEELWERYTELTQDRPVSLEAFVEQAASGALGRPVDPATLERFLRRVEGMMLANIEAKLQEAPHLGALHDEAVERTRAMIDDLIDRYATRRPPAPPGSGHPGPPSPALSG